MTSSQVHSEFGPQEREPRGLPALRLPRQLAQRLREVSAALPGLRRRWNDLLTQATPDGAGLPASALGEADRIYTELGGLLERAELARLRIHRRWAGGRGYPIPTDVDDAIRHANAQMIDSNEPLIGMHGLAPRPDGTVPPRVVRSLAREFDRLVGCLADVLATVVGTPGAPPPPADGTGGPGVNAPGD